LRITIFAKRFESGGWKFWERESTPEEVEAAKAFARTFSRMPTDIDYREAARYEFDRAYGSAGKPAEGDVRGLRVDVIISASRSEGSNDPVAQKDRHSWLDEAKSQKLPSVPR